MGKTSVNSKKHKDKRLARKQEQRKIADGMSFVTSANKLKELNSLCKDLLSFDDRGSEVDIYIKRVTELEKDVLNWAIGLTESNMKTYYESSSWGWNKSKKVEEMTDDSAWYIIAKDNTKGTPVAFSHFRFDMDFGDPVLYCYELQVEAGNRRRGLGARLLQILEVLARDTKMHFIRLTVLTHNVGSTAFFKSLGYTLDETSPAPEDAEHYEILSKLAQIQDKGEENAVNSA